MRRKLHIAIIFTFNLVWLILFQAVCLGATYYLDAVNGDDTNPGTSAAPWRTIAKAFQTAIYGDTVYIRNGNYGEINNPISFPVYTGSMIEPLPSDTQFITFKADEGLEPVFTRIELGDRYSNYYVPYIFEGIRIEPEAGFSGVVLTRCIGPRLKNLTIIGQSLATGYGVELGYGGDGVNKNNDIRIEDCIIYTWERGIHAYGSNIAITGNEIYNIGSDHVQIASGGVSGYNILIENNHIHHTNKVDPLAHPDGVAFVGLTNVIFRNNTIHDLDGAQGIFDHGSPGGSPIPGSKNVLIENNLMYNVGVTELQFHSDTTTTENWTIRNNTIIGANLVQQVSVRSGINHKVYNNIFVCSYGAAEGALDYHDYNIYIIRGDTPGNNESNSYGYAWLGDWDSTHNAIEPELFVDPVNKDFRLKAGCRAVDFGDPNNYPTTDLLGNPRDDGAPDAGCYEYITLQRPDELEDKIEVKCYNNVFNPTKGEEALIWVEIKEKVHIKLALYDSRGRRIKKIADEKKEPPLFKYHWNGKDDSGSIVGSGLYFVHIQAGDYKKTKKIVVVK